MAGTFLKIDWSVIFTWREFWGWVEVWALFIPLLILLRRRRQLPPILKPIAWYIIIALVLNFLATFIWRFQVRLNFPGWLTNNIPLYHAHSIIRLLMFAWFFNLLKEPFLQKIKKFLPFVFLLFVLLMFTVIKPVEHFWLHYSSELHAVEAGVLLFYCLQHYVYLAQAEQIPYSNSRSVNWITAGITLYVGINFFLFLFYETLINLSVAFHVFWNVHNVAYLILCCLIAKGIYESNKP